MLDKVAGCCTGLGIDACASVPVDAMVGAGGAGAADCGPYSTFVAVAVRKVNASVMEAADLLKDAGMDDSHLLLLVVDGYLVVDVYCIRSYGSEVDCRRRTQRADAVGIHLEGVHYSRVDRMTCSCFLTVDGEQA